MNFIKITLFSLILVTVNRIEFRLASFKWDCIGIHFVRFLQLTAHYFQGPSCIPSSYQPVLFLRPEIDLFLSSKAAAFSSSTYLTRSSSAMIWPTLSKPTSPAAVMRSSASIYVLVTLRAARSVWLADLITLSPRDEERDAFLVVSSCSRKMRAAADSLWRGYRLSAIISIV